MYGLDGVYLYLPMEKATECFVFLKLPFLSKQWPGSNFSGLGNSVQSYKMEDSNGNTVVPWNQERENRMACYHTYLWFIKSLTLLIIVD